MTAFMKKVAAQRLSGRRPSSFQALAAATVAGAAAAGLTYRALRA
jgi:hypothetical protein